MENFQIFDEEEHKNWLKAVVGLRCFQKPLERFIDEQIGNFHQALRNECGPNMCVRKCGLKNWKPRPNQSPPLDCGVCSPWRDVILTHHTSQRGKVMWMNSEPHLWSRDKWEVAKVYMTDGHKNHKSIGDFDIASLLSLMTQCQHFKRFKLGGLCAQVANVRNNVMHSASFQLKRDDLRSYLDRIRALGKALAEHDPGFRNLSADIDEIQNLEFRLILPDNMESEAIRAQHEKELEDRLFAAVQSLNEKGRTQDFLRSKVVMLEQCCAESDKAMQDLRLCYTTKLRRQKKMIDQRDRAITELHSAVEQKTYEDACSSWKLKMLEEKVAQQEQEIHLACGRHHVQDTMQFGPAVPIAIGAMAVAFMIISVILHCVIIASIVFLISKSLSIKASPKCKRTDLKWK